MTNQTHTSPRARAASYDGRGPVTGVPTAPVGSVRLVADVQRAAELPAQRRLVPELRRESPGTEPSTSSPRVTLLVSARRPTAPAFDVPYEGVHQPNERARPCRTCPTRTTWTHGFCSRCTTTQPDTGCPRCDDADGRRVLPPVAKRAQLADQT